MRKLLSADFSRLWKSREFYISAIFMFALAVARIFSYALNSSNNIDDDGFFIYALAIGIVMAAFVSLFVGTEHCHTLRNKLIVGHTRRNTYLSNYIVCTVAGWIFCVCYLFVELIVGIPIVGGFRGETADIIATILCVFLLTAAYSGIFVLIAMLHSNQAITAVVCILLALALLVFGVNVQTRLLEPEKIEIMDYTIDGEEPISVFEDNPKYLSDDNIRQVYEVLNDALPGGQTIQLSGMLGNIKMPSVQLFIYEIFMILITNGLGLVIFHKKNLK